jgi:hypothetical protein
MTNSRRRRRNTRRGFEAASTFSLSQARAERLPCSRRWLRVAPLALLGLIAVMAAWVLLDDRFYVYRADVVGTVRLSPEEVFWASDLPGLHVLWVNADRVEAQILEALPSLESADVSCGLLANCTITVVERQSRITWDDGGQLWWVDADGVIFPCPPSVPPNGGEEGGGGWIVRGPLPRDEQGRLDEPVRVALAELWASGFEVGQVLSYVPTRGLVFTDAHGWRVIVGQGPGMDERLRTLGAVAAHLEARGLMPRFVDVRFPDAPYYSLTNDW